MHRLLREPLVHFILIAALVFAGHEIISARSDKADRTIYVSTAEMERMAALFASEARTLPGEQDIRAMVTDHVRQEALAREARRLGLDRGDIVIDRRLAQKMNFMISDLSEQAAPTEAELEDWYAQHTDKFSRPTQITFQHVFFSNPEDPRIEPVRAALNTNLDGDWRALGDPFILQREYAGLPKREVARLFGPAFADALFGAPGGEASWSGPLSSPYGVHLCRITKLTPVQTPPFAAVRDAVEADWRDTTARTRNAQAVAELLEKYDVVIEAPAP